MMFTPWSISSPASLLIASTSSVNDSFPVFDAFCGTKLDIMHYWQIVSKDITVVSGNKYPMIPILRPPTSITSDLDVFPIIWGSWSVWMFDTKTGKLAASRNGRRPSIPSSNSWLPRDYKFTSLLSSGAEHWSCKPGVESSNLSGGKLILIWKWVGSKFSIGPCWINEFDFPNWPWGGVVRVNYTK